MEPEPRDKTSLFDRTNPGPSSRYWLIFEFLFLVALTGCSPGRKETPQQRSEQAKALFEKATKGYISSSEASDPMKTKLRSEAAFGYEQLARRYSEQDYWAAQALRNLGNIRAVEGKLDDAVRNYSAAAEKYPQQRWEALMAWKSAADLLWEAGRKEEAKGFYRKILVRYDLPEAPQVEKMIVRGSKLRLEDREPPRE